MEAVAIASSGLQIASYGFGIATLVSPSSSSSVFAFVMLSKILIYLRYLALNYSEKTLLFFEAYSAGSFSLPIGTVM